MDLPNLFIEMWTSNLVTEDFAMRFKKRSRDVLIVALRQPPSQLQQKILQRPRPQHGVIAVPEKEISI